MSHMDRAVGLFYIVLVVIGAAVVVMVAWSTLVKHKEEPDTHKLAERERIWLVAALLMLASLLFATIFFTPYGQSSSGKKQIVNVMAQQFLWNIQPDTVKAGQPIEFRIDSKDVNHGFGLYNPSGALIKQVQVIPDRDQHMIITLKNPGTYQILCIEFCGAGHHLMQAQLKVTQ